MNDRDELLEQAVFGKEVEAFFASNVGRFVVAKANEQALRSMEVLKTWDPEDSHKIRSLQNDIKVAESILEWLEGSVRQGLQAINIIDGQS